MYLEIIKKQFEYYKMLGEKTFEQIPVDKFFWQLASESNSISIIVKHLHGNMLSRWTNFLTTDGEKEWRKRDAEFENQPKTRSEVMLLWEEGWACVFKAVDSLSESDLEKAVYIREIEHTVVDAINRQIAHYAYHIGQIVFIGKLVKNESWKSLSIPKAKPKN